MWSGRTRHGVCDLSLCSLHSPLSGRCMLAAEVLVSLVAGCGTVKDLVHLNVKEYLSISLSLCRGIEVSGGGGMA